MKRLERAGEKPVIKKSFKKSCCMILSIIVVLLAIIINEESDQVSAATRLESSEIYEIRDEPEIEVLDVNPNALVEHGKWESSGKLRFGISNPGVPNVRFGTTVDHIYSLPGAVLGSTPGIQVIGSDSPNRPEDIFFRNGTNAVIDGLPAIVANSKSTVSVNGGVLSTKIEMLSKGRGIVEHRYTFTNKGLSKIEFYPYKLVDTMLAGDDNVPIKSLGGAEGVSIESQGYLLRYLLKGDNRANSYKGERYGLEPTDVFDSLSNPDKSQLTAFKGQTLFKDGDTAIYQIWPKASLGIGKSITVSYDVEIEAIDDLNVAKTGENKTNGTVNNVGDNYEYTIKMITKKDAYKKVKIEDTLPEGLATPSKIVLKTGVIGGVQELDVSKVYNPDSRKITVDSLDISKNTTKSLIYETVIEGSAQGKTLVNQAVISGKDIDNEAFMEEIEHSMYVEEITLGRVLVNYVDVSGEPLADEEILAGEIETAYPKIEAKKIMGYVLVETEGAVEGTFKEEDQFVTFKYLNIATGFKLTHAGQNSFEESLSEGMNVKQGEKLSYSLKLNSVAELKDLEATYSKTDFSLKLSENLENVADIKVVNGVGEDIGTGKYDEVTQTLRGELLSDKIAIQDTVLLSYNGTVKKTAKVDDSINSLGQVQLDVKAGPELITVDELSSNQLSNKIEAGLLEFISAPRSLAFGEDIIISPKDEIYQVKVIQGNDLVIQDNRGPGNKWELTAVLGSEFTSDQSILEDVLYYATENDDVLLTNEAQLIEAKLTENGDIVNVSDQWSESKGIRLKVKAGQAKAASYIGEILWTLRNVPSF